MDRLTLSAPAKLNLFLEVTGKRENGYHDIESIMMTLPLADSVTVEKTENESRVEVISLLDGCARISDLAELDQRDNICFKAAELFLARLEEAGQGYHGGLRITVDKKIPVKAGLAGGSADAAAVLKALDLIFQSPFQTEELCKIGASLGADVPFCIKGGCALCTGIGDVMRSVPSKATLHGLVTLEKDVKLSTGAAYSMIDAASDRAVRSADKMVRALELGDVRAVARECYNVFGIACGYSTAAASILTENGALCATLSGAGPSVFGIFDSKEKTDAARVALLAEGYPVFEF